MIIPHHTSRDSIKPAGLVYAELPKLSEYSLASERRWRPKKCQRRRPPPPEKSCVRHVAPLSQAEVCSGYRYVFSGLFHPPPLFLSQTTVPFYHDNGGHPKNTYPPFPSVNSTSNTPGPDRDSLSLLSSCCDRR